MEVSMASSYRVIVDYKDGTKRTLETADGSRAMKEAAGACYEEDTAKTVSLEKDGETIWKEPVKAYKQ